MRTSLNFTYLLTAAVLTTYLFIYVGILIQRAKEVTLLRNEISNFDYTGISIGWSWNFAPEGNAPRDYGGSTPALFGSIGHRVEGNVISALGTDKRTSALGDAMACIYTLGVLNGTVIRGNMCHDVAASYTGGYCLSQDQGSSNILFESNVCIRTASSSQNQHYGLNNTFRRCVSVFYNFYLMYHMTQYFTNCNTVI